MDRKLLKERAKDILRKDYKRILLAIIIVAILSLSFISIGRETTLDYTTYETSSYAYFTIFNIKIPITTTPFIAGVLFIVALARLLYTYIIASPLTYGLNNHLKYIALGRGDDFDIFEGLRQHHKDVVVLHLMRNLTVFLWSFCLIIPGIMKAIEYQYVDEIFEEHPDWDYKMVLAESSRLTYGYKWQLFVLDLSFFFWHLVFAFLDNITLGLASYLLEPYTRMTNVEAYFWLKEIKQPIVEEPIAMLQNENTF